MKNKIEEQLFRYSWDTISAADFQAFAKKHGVRLKDVRLRFEMHTGYYDEVDLEFYLYAEK